MTSNQRVREHRERMRERGFRPIQLWVPDTRREEFVAEAGRQAALAAAADQHGDDREFVQAVSLSWEE